MTLYGKHHLVRSTAGRDGICPVCRADFPTDTLLATHIATEHPDPVDEGATDA